MQPYDLYATLRFIGCKGKKIFNLVVVCEEKKNSGRKERERE